MSQDQEGTRKYIVADVKKMVHQYQKLERSIADLEREYERISKTFDERPGIPSDWLLSLETLNSIIEGKQLDQEAPIEQNTVQIDITEIEHETNRKRCFGYFPLKLPLHQRLLFKLRKLFWRNTEISISQCEIV
ncbi:hypothetical protein GWI33_012708 [Rhynchophorus ferrugineus]|uniref:Uncharacterized protein n=1 Tax=Rhynchophorus ferrugineus TaxID=354439 RepID=A0A834IB51_RHYFE|nr:hypothetical protein GWI33_012708 [Rhynchophorus ferrugineus]